MNIAMAMDYFRHPDVDGEDIHGLCGCPFKDHGWLDFGMEDRLNDRLPGITVCPSIIGPFGGQDVTDLGWQVVSRANEVKGH